MRPQRGDQDSTSGAAIQRWRGLVRRSSECRMNFHGDAASFRHRSHGFGRRLVSGLARRSRRLQRVQAEHGFAGSNSRHDATTSDNSAARARTQSRGCRKPVSSAYMGPGGSLSTRETWTRIGTGDGCRGVERRTVLNYCWRGFSHGSAQQAMFFHIADQ